MKIRNAVLAKIALVTLLGLSGQAQAQWNAYNDFYLSPTASGWSGTTTPSVLQAAWGYYAANVNLHGGFPSQIGAYFTPSSFGSGTQNLYQYSNLSPLGAGYFFNNTTFDPIGGTGLPAYRDNQGWGTSLARYDTPWFSGAPGYNTGQSNLIWMQSSWLGTAGAEGIATVVTWKAPETGVYAFAGKFVAASNYDVVPTQTGTDSEGRPIYTNVSVARKASVAIVDNLGSANLVARTVLGLDQIETFAFQGSYNAGDVVQFQVASNGSGSGIGNTVGLEVSATAIPEPSSCMLLAAGLGALCLIRRRR